MTVNLNNQELKKLELLNNKVSTEEIRAYKFYKNLEPQLKEMIATGSIDDYNIWNELQVFTHNKAVCQKYDVEVGDPHLY